MNEITKYTKSIFDLLNSNSLEDINVGIGLLNNMGRNEYKKTLNIMCLFIDNSEPNKHWAKVQSYDLYEIEPRAFINYSYLFLKTQYYYQERYLIYVG